MLSIYIEKCGFMYLLFETADVVHEYLLIWLNCWIKILFSYKRPMKSCSEREHFNELFTSLQNKKPFPHKQIQLNNNFNLLRDVYVNIKN